MNEQTDLGLSGSDPTAKAPVTCLGLTFENDEARRAHFTKELREKLKDPEFREIEGFPIGEEEDILALSDPPYYTACPNPWISDFVSEWELQKPESSKDEPYHREPFAANVSEGKNNPIYNAHSYHTKVPHTAVMRYIEHYTEPGDIILDGFCGTGMAGVAAQALNRQSILCDLSPLATFLSANFCTTYSADVYKKIAEHITAKMKSSIDPLYRINREWRDFTIYSAIVECDNCQHQFSQWEASFDKSTKAVSASMRCESCGTQLNAKTLKHATTTVFDPVLKRSVRTKKRIQVFTRARADTGARELEISEDGNSYAEYAATITQYPLPITPLPEMYESHFKRNLEKEGVTHFHHFYTPRNLAACLKLWNMVSNDIPLLKFAFLNTSWHATIMRRYNAGGGHRPKTNTLYIPALSSEGRVSKIYTKKLKDIERFLGFKKGVTLKPLIGTFSATHLEYIPTASVDYIFIDPPFGSNIMYSDLNFIWESWLRVRTNIDNEAIENHVQRKGLGAYRELMQKCFEEFYRVLKPNRWMTVEFSNTNASIWNAIQSAMSEAGFIVANVSTLDKKQRSINSYTSTTSVKQDLVISAYKPNVEFERQLVIGVLEEGGAWDFVRTHLKHLPVIKQQGNALEFVPERDPRMLFDQMVSFFVRKGLSVPLSSHEFQSGLGQRFVERDGMYFLSDQASQYDSKKLTVSEPMQPSMFVSDEVSAIQWLRQVIKQKPQTFSDLNPQFMQQLGGWRKDEAQLDLRELLNQNFLVYDGKGPVPEQIHAYLSSNWRSLRNLPKDAAELVAKAKDRWYVPDPSKAGDLEKLRERALLREFETYVQRSKKFSVRDKFRLEALRAGFKKAWQNRDYALILDVAAKIPDKILEEDQKLLMWRDNAQTRLGDD